MIGAERKILKDEDNRALMQGDIERIRLNWQACRVEGGGAPRCLPRSL